MFPVCTYHTVTSVYERRFHQCTYQSIQFNFSGTTGQTQLCTETDGLSWSCRSLQRVILGNESNLLSYFERSRIYCVVIETHIGTDRKRTLGPRTSSQDIQQTSFSRTRWAHDGSDFLLGYFTPYTRQQLTSVLAFLSSLIIDR